MKTFNGLEIDSNEWSISINELKSFKGFENISDDDAESVIKTLVRLATIAYNV